MRNFLILVMLLFCTPLMADDRQAWENCKTVRQATLSITLNAEEARTAYAQAEAAYSSVPPEHRQMFAGPIQELRDAMEHATSAQARGESRLLIAEAGFSVLEQRVMSGEWDGVEEVANYVRRRYRLAQGLLMGASMDYDRIAHDAPELEQDINDFLSMLEAFEDFFGPLP